VLGELHPAWPVLTVVWCKTGHAALAAALKYWLEVCDSIVAAVEGPETCARYEDPEMESCERMSV
jgi:hypothetical protein